MQHRAFFSFSSCRPSFKFRQAIIHLNPLSSFWGVLYKRRMDLQLEQQDVAKIIGVTESSIWNWESGMNPAKRYMKKIEGFLEIWI